MQISRSFWWRCSATAFLFSTLLFSFSLAAQDSEAQAKARQALEQKIKDNQTQPTPTVIEVEPAKPVQPEPAPAPKQTPPPKATTQPKPAATSETQFMNMPQSTSAETADKLNQALHQKEMELDAQRPVQPVTAAPVAASTGYAMPASATAVHVGTTQPQPASSVVHVGTPATTKPSKGKPVVAAAAVPTGPPTGLSASKTQRLADLNQQYNMDKVTPEEYHRQRAKILSEP
jgi:hypothetical protein